MAKYPWENPDLMEQMQYDMLWDNLNDNPNFTYNASLARNMQLETTNKKIISAINEIKREVEGTDGTLVNFTSFYNELFGDVTSDPMLHDNIKKIDENALKAIYKTYTMIVGNPDDPVDITELGDNINKCISTLKNLIDVKEQEISEISKIISDIDGLREAITLEDIPAYKVVYMNDDGQLGIADCNNQEHCDNIVGITVLSALQGQKAKYCLRGEVTNPEWSFIKKGTNVFVARNGELEKTPIEGCAFIQEFGFIVDENVINIDIEEGIIIN